MEGVTLTFFDQLFRLIDNFKCSFHFHRECYKTVCNDHCRRCKTNDIVVFGECAGRCTQIDDVTHDLNSKNTEIHQYNAVEWTLTTVETHRFGIALHCLKQFHVAAVVDTLCARTLDGKKRLNAILSNIDLKVTWSSASVTNKKTRS